MMIGKIIKFLYFIKECGADCSRNRVIVIWMRVKCEITFWQS